MRRKIKSVYHSFSRSLRYIINLVIVVSIIYFVITIINNGLGVSFFKNIYNNIMFLGTGAITFFGIYDGIISFIENNRIKITPDSPEILTFVDRKEELMMLRDQLVNHKNINVYGQSGIGKSYLAKQLSLILNNSQSLSKEYLYLVPNTEVFAFYFSLKTNESIEQSIVETISLSSNLEIKTLPDVLKSLEKNGSENICFIFDGVKRDPIQRTEIELLIKKMSSDKISFLIVSEEPIRPIQIKTEEFNIGEKTFTDIEIKELITKFYPSQSNIDLKSILTISSGLPVLIDLILRNNHSNQKDSPDKNSYLFGILESLWYEEESYFLFRKLIVLCIFNYSANIHNLSYDKKKLTSLCDKHLVRYDFTNDTVNIHKLIELEFHKIFTHRDNKEYQKLHHTEFVKLKSSDDKKAMAHLLCSKNEKINSEYCFIVNLYEKLFVSDSYDDLYNYFDLFEMIENKSSINRQLATYFTYGKLYSLMGIGKYSEADTFFKNLSIEYGTLLATGNLTDMDFRFLFKKADLSHLVTNYQVALEDLELILLSLDKSEFSKETKQIYELDCQLLIAHIHAHEGISIDLIIQDYSLLLKKVRALYLNDTENYGTIYVKTLYGLICSYLVKHDHKRTTKYQDYFEEITQVINRNPVKLEHLQYRANRHLSMYLRQCHNIDESKNILQESILYFKSRSHRIIYDFYFSLADLLREEEDFEAAIKYYLMAEEYASDISDINLYIYCRLGIILSELNMDTNTSKEQYINKLKKLLTKSQEAKLNIHSLHIQLVLYALSNQQDNQEQFLNKLVNTGLDFEANLIKKDWTIDSLNKLQLIVR